MVCEIDVFFEDSWFHAHLVSRRPRHEWEIVSPCEALRSLSKVRYADGSIEDGVDETRIRFRCVECHQHHLLAGGQSLAALRRRVTPCKNCERGAVDTPYCCLKCQRREGHGRHCLGVRCIDFDSEIDLELRCAIETGDLTRVSRMVEPPAPVECLFATLMCRHPRLGHGAPPAMRALPLHVWHIIFEHTQGLQIHMLNYAPPQQLPDPSDWCPWECPYGDCKCEGKFPLGFLTPLMLACRCGHLPIVRHLIAEAGADVNCVDQQCYTAIIHATVTGCSNESCEPHLDVIRYLLQNTSATLLTPPRTSTEIPYGTEVFPCSHRMATFFG